MEEKFVKVKGYEGYEVSNTGKIKSLKTNRLLKPQKNNCGYLYILLSDQNKKVKINLIHRLVFDSFIGIEDGLEINHLDEDKENNRLDNLKWVSEQENVKQAKPPKKQEKHFQGEIEGEEWRYFRDTLYQISNKGRIKNTKTGRITYGAKIDSGYRRFEIYFQNGKHKRFLVHQLVYECFISPEFEEINHINGDKTDNRVENLENVSHRENALKAVYETNAWKFRRVAQYDKEGNLIRTYANASEAGRAMGILPSSMRNCIRLREGRHKDFIFKYIEDEGSTDHPIVE